MSYVCGKKIPVIYPRDRHRTGQSCHVLCPVLPCPVLQDEIFFLPCPACPAGQTGQGTGQGRTKIFRPANLYFYCLLVSFLW